MPKPVKFHAKSEHEGLPDGPRVDADARAAIDLLTARVAELELALTGVCQMIGATSRLHPDLEEWFKAYQKRS